MWISLRIEAMLVTLQRLRPPGNNLAALCPTLQLTFQDRAVKFRQWLFISLFIASAQALSSGAYIAEGDIAKVRPGVTTTKDLQQMFGEPLRKMHFPSRGQDAWEYEYREYSDLYAVSFTVDPAGVVRDILRMRRDTPT
jgi:hypothetical protein